MQRSEPVPLLARHRRKPDGTAQLPAQVSEPDGRVDLVDGGSRGKLHGYAFVVGGCWGNAGTGDPSGVRREGQAARLLHEEQRDEPGPAGLVARAETGAVVAVEVLVEQQQVAPVRIGLEQLGAPEHGAPPALVAQEGRGQAPADLVGHLEQVQLVARAGRALAPSGRRRSTRGAAEPADDDQVHGEPHRSPPVRVAAEHRRVATPPARSRRGTPGRRCRTRTGARRGSARSPGPRMGSGTPTRRGGSPGSAEAGRCRRATSGSSRSRSALARWASDGIESS